MMHPFRRLLRAAASGYSPRVSSLAWLALAPWVLAQAVLAQAPQRPHEPVNSEASPEARALLAEIYATAGGTILSGQHEYNHKFDSAFSYLRRTVGEVPVIWGSDFSNYPGQPGWCQRVTDHALERHRAGHVVTMMWHARRPHDEGPMTFRDNVQGELTAAQWDSLTTPGSDYHARWLRQVDTVASYIAQLRDAGVPVLWRPYHEMNGAWFWWGGKPGPGGYQALWRMMYERLVDHHGLDNLIWVWNANAPRDIPGDRADAYAEYFPGLDVVDVLATDVYHSDYEQGDYLSLLELADGKAVALGEVGAVPSDAVLAAQPRWRWFMVWDDIIATRNDPAEVRRLYGREDVLTLGEW